MTPRLHTWIRAPATILLDTLSTPIGNTARPSVATELRELGLPAAPDSLEVVRADLEQPGKERTAMTVSVSQQRSTDPTIISVRHHSTRTVLKDY